MLRTLQVTNGGWTEVEGNPLEMTGLRWVDIEAATEAEFQLLEHGFKFHPLAVEDCRHLDQRSKAEEYGDHLFVVLHTYSADKDPTELTLHELHVFLRKDLLVSVHARHLAAVDLTRARCLKGDQSGCAGPGVMLHNLADAMVDQMFPVVEGLEDRVDTIAENLMNGRPDPRHLLEIQETKRAVREIRRLTAPAREVLGLLSRAQFPLITEHETPYFRNVLDHLHSISQQIELCREHVDDARDLHLNAQSNRTNEIVKRLSITATIGLPLTLITGFFGMNFTMLPFDDPSLMYAALAAMVLVPGAIMAFVWWRRWI